MNLLKIFSLCRTWAHWPIVQALIFLHHKSIEKWRIAPVATGQKQHPWHAPSSWVFHAWQRWKTPQHSKAKRCPRAACKPCCCHVAGKINCILCQDIYRYSVYGAFETQCLFKVKSKWAFSLITQRNVAATQFCSIMASSYIHNHAAPIQLAEDHISAAPQSF